MLDDPSDCLSEIGPEGKCEGVRVAAIQMTAGPDIDANLAEAGRLLKKLLPRARDLRRFPNISA